MPARPPFFAPARRPVLPASCALLLLAGAIAALWTPAAHAGTFSLMADSSTAQTLGSGSGQTGTIAAGKTLSVGGSTVAVTISGSSATLNNQGTILQTGTGRAVRDNTGVTGLVINNGSSSNAAALMQTADGDVIQMNKSPASVTLNNYGAMVSLNASAGGAQAVDFAALTAGMNIVNNFAGGLLKAHEADAVRPGANGVVNNAGTILSIASTGGGSDGVDGQDNSGIQVNNLATGLISGGRHGITGGQADAAAASSMQITNHAGGVIRGNNGAGVNLDGYNGRQLATIVNHGTILGNGVSGDGDGVDVDGLVNLTNTGVIRSSNAFSAPANCRAYSEGVSVGGGGIINSGTIEGLVAAGNGNAIGRGITLIGNDIASGLLAGTREGLYGNAEVNNQAGGVIRGQGGAAIISEGAAAASGYSIVIRNQAGALIQGGGLDKAAIVSSKDATTIYNAGVIDGASNGKAIHLGSGDNAVYILGGLASVIGDIDGGVGGVNRLALAPGAGNTFNYAGAISHFQNVEIGEGKVILSGVSDYAGATLVKGGTLVLEGENRLAGGGALLLDGGTLELLNGGALGQTFASLSLSGANRIDLHGKGLTFLALGDIVTGASLLLQDAIGADLGGFGLRILGDLTQDAGFHALLQATTLNGGTAGAYFDGMYTLVRGEVPEPGSLLLLLAGLAGLYAAARTKRRKYAA